MSGCILGWMSREPIDPTFANTTEFMVQRSARDPVPEVSFDFESPALSGAAVRVVEGHVVESLGALYQVTLELCTSDQAADFGALLGARGTLLICRGPRTRRLCGVVRRVERLSSWGDQRRGRVVLVPALWALSKRTDSRVFQNLTVLQIAREILKEAGLADPPLRDATTREHPVREYCVQYRETDLDFLCRLLEDEGITLYFNHDGSAEVPVLADSPSYGIVPTIDRRPVPFSPGQAELAHVEIVQRLDFSQELRSTGATVRDYDFTRPAAEIEMVKSAPRGDGGPRPRYASMNRFTFGDYDEGVHAYASHDGARRAELLHQDEDARVGRGAGGGNVTGFMPGRTFVLVEHEHPDLDQSYLITRVEHVLHAPEALHSEQRPRAPSVGNDRYRNEFECVLADAPWVPPRRSPKPAVLATQTATVTGRAGEEIYTDFHGRIKVQFHWDRKGQKDEHSSCWIRVAQVWAGAGWGFQFIPRVGMEVVVQFLEGDPDQPLVTGCVYNGINNTPYLLPDERTRSTIKSNSSLGGEGYNEIRFEDLKGQEEVFFHAQRDHNEVIERNHSETVKGSQSISVGGDQSMSIGHDQTITVANDESITVGGDQTIKVAGDESFTVTGDQTIVVEGDESFTVTGDQTMTITGDQDFTVTGDHTEKVTGDHDVTADGDATLTAACDIDVTAGGDVTVTAKGGDCDIAAGGDVTVKAKGGDCDIAASGDVTVKANGGDCDVSASAIVTVVGGSQVHIGCGGASITLVPGAITMSAPVITLNGGGATLVLDGNATLKGGTVNLNC
jgi:type VI secretion system secreted protein VgrG